jgi:aryl-alcohol dehydrogenase-like predicted oxidoreductase
MEQIKIGTSGLTTSRVALGTWAIGGWMWGALMKLNQSRQSAPLWNAA